MKKNVWLSVVLVLMLVFTSFAAYADEPVYGEDNDVVADVENDDEEVVEAEEAVAEDEEAEAEEEMDEAVEEEADEAGTVILLVLGQNTAWVNGEAKVLDAAPYVDENNRTLVPLRFIGEELGADIDWNAEERAVTYTKGDIEIILHLGMAHAIVNGEEVEMDTAPVISNDRTMVPVRFISETLGYQVDWDGDARTVTITDVLVEEEVEEELEEELEEEPEEELEEELEDEVAEDNDAEAGDDANAEHDENEEEV